MTITVKEEIDLVMGNLRDKLPNFKDRPAQKIMIAEIAKTFWGALLPDDAKYKNQIKCDFPEHKLASPKEPLQSTTPTLKGGA